MVNSYPLFDSMDLKNLVSINLGEFRIVLVDRSPDRQPDKFNISPNRKKLDKL